MKHLIENLQDLGAVARWRSAAVSMRLPDPVGSGQEFTLIVFQTSGTFYLAWLDLWSEKGGYDPAIVGEYRDRVAELTGVTMKEWATVTAPLDRLLPKSQQFTEIVESFLSRIRKAAEAMGG